MIAKLSWGKDFGGIVEYLTKHRDHEVLDLHDISSIETAADEMAFTASFNKRVTARVCHVSISAANEDGKLDRDTWLSCANAVEAEFGLQGHHRVVVRHKDKTHDHIHIFWCTVSQDSFRSPPRQWFLAKGAKGHDAGALALTVEEFKRIAANRRTQGSWNRRALIRLQQVCRKLEKRLRLRQLRTPRQIAEACKHDETQLVDVGLARREERTGALPLVDMASMIRTALDAPSWPDARAALARIGLGFEPALRVVKNADPKISGLIIHDLADPGNRMPASQLDIAGRKYGLRQIEKRHDHDAPTMEEWWPERGPDPIVVTTPDPNDERRQLREAYALERRRHRAAEADKATARRELGVYHRSERHETAAALMHRRRTEAGLLPVHTRRAFYATFSQEVRAAEMAALLDRHRVDLAALKRARMMSWSDFLAAREPQAVATVAVARIDADIRPGIGVVVPAERSVPRPSFDAIIDRIDRERLHVDVILAGGDRRYQVVGLRPDEQSVLDDPTHRSRRRAALKERADPQRHDVNELLSVIRTHGRDAAVAATRSSPATLWHAHMSLIHYAKHPHFLREVDTADAHWHDRPIEVGSITAATTVARVPRNEGLFGNYVAGPPVEPAADRAAQAQDNSVAAAKVNEDRGPTPDTQPTREAAREDVRLDPVLPVPAVAVEQSAAPEMRSRKADGEDVAGPIGDRLRDAVVDRSVPEVDTASWVAVPEQADEIGQVVEVDAPALGQPAMEHTTVADEPSSSGNEIKVPVQGTPAAVDLTTLSASVSELASPPKTQTFDEQAERKPSSIDIARAAAVELAHARAGKTSPALSPASYDRQHDRPAPAPVARSDADIATSGRDDSVRSEPRDSAGDASIADGRAELAAGAQIQPAKLIQPAHPSSTSDEIKRNRKDAIDGAVRQICSPAASGTASEDIRAPLRRWVRKIGERVAQGSMSLGLEGKTVVAASSMNEPGTWIDAIARHQGGYDALRVMATAVASFGIDAGHRNRWTLHGREPIAPEYSAVPTRRRAQIRD